ncbi:Cas10/Cmr2 second palm domain-containing protein [Clostridium scatologenes]|uniref:Metallopeptidase, M24 family n=1 Tax=Clostridium scatologenes TaxID=1548 RepID=A0A0E3M561_CLOSL|nr:type III-B CRISPR-associated protein Cas10/Cmr2 [Clostridium scatologenes]AKA67807.1 metallopeptidase, M24 family [Clostridium scatologenes]
MHNKLMLITIAGIQEYISNARKTADFFNGSKIITEFLKEIYEIVKHFEGYKDFDTILPCELDKHELDIPNYFIAKVSSNLENNELENKLRKILSKSLKNNFNKIYCYLNLDVYIVVVDFKSSYQVSYKSMYKKLDGYKNNRFRDYSLIYNIHENKNFDLQNCTICGKNRGKYISNTNIELIKTEQYYTSENKYIKDKEVLCEDCLRKRKYDYHKEYPSTVDIAVMEWIDEVNKNEKIQHYDKMIGSIVNNKRDCIANFYHLDYIYSHVEGNMCDEYVKALDEINNLDRKDQKCKVGNASRYYALIKADIDDLGKHFNGKYLKESIKNDDIIFEKFQKRLSKEILKLSEGVKEKLYSFKNNYETKKLDIYLGGDDLLFFCPLYKVFEIVKFIDERIKNINIEDNEKNLTISKSIVVAHDSVPLTQVINLSRKSLDIAKEKFEKQGKNALVISIINSSGIVRTSYLKNERKTVDELVNLINGFKNYISSGFISNIERQLFLLGENMSLEEYEVLMNVIMNVIERVASKQIKDNEIKCKENLKYLISKFVYVNSSNYFLDLKGYFNLLYILKKYSIEIINDINGGSI